MFFFPPLAFLSLGDRLQIGAVKCRKKQNKSRIVSCGLNSFYSEKHSSPFLFLKPIDWLTMMLLFWNFQIPKMLIDANLFCHFFPHDGTIGFTFMMPKLHNDNNCAAVQWCTARLHSTIFLEFCWYHSKLSYYDCRI